MGENSLLVSLVNTWRPGLQMSKFSACFDWFLMCLEVEKKVYKHLKSKSKAPQREIEKLWLFVFE